VNCLVLGCLNIAFQSRGEKRKVSISTQLIERNGSFEAEKVAQKGANFNHRLERDGETIFGDARSQPLMRTNCTMCLEIQGKDLGEIRTIGEKGVRGEI